MKKKIACVLFFFLLMVNFAVPASAEQKATVKEDLKRIVDGNVVENWTRDTAISLPDMASPEDIKKEARKVIGSIEELNRELLGGKKGKIVIEGAIPEMKRKLDDAVSGVAKANETLGRIEASTEGIKTATDKIDGIKTATDKIDGIKTATDKIEGIKTATDKIEGIKTATDKIEGIKTATDGLKDIVDGINKVLLYGFVGVGILVILLIAIVVIRRRTGTPTTTP